MDTWFSDVFTLPMNGQVVVARISRALSGREKGAGGPAGHGFSATFKDLSFVDLVQALGTGGKSVRMRIENGSGMQADICFRQGRIVFAVCGEEKGVDVVYRVICWQDAGTSRIEPIQSFPPENVSVPTDYISRRIPAPQTGAKPGIDPGGSSSTRFPGLRHQGPLPPSAGGFGPTPVNRISTRSVAPHTGFRLPSSFLGQWMSGSPSRKSHFRQTFRRYRARTR